MSERLEQVQVAVIPGGLIALDSKSAFSIQKPNEEPSDLFEALWGHDGDMESEWEWERSELRKRLKSSSAGSQGLVRRDEEENKWIDYAVTWCCYDLLFLGAQIPGEGAGKLIKLDRDGLLKLREVLKHIPSRELRLWVLGDVVTWAREWVLGNG
jgi:hypothetical protein